MVWCRNLQGKVQFTRQSLWSCQRSCVQLYHYESQQTLYSPASSPQWAKSHLFSHNTAAATLHCRLTCRAVGTGGQEGNSPLHFGNFVTARATKSIITSRHVFNASYEFPWVFKIKILCLDLILDHIWAKLWA